MTPIVMATGATNSSDSYQWTAHAIVMAATLRITRGVGGGFLDSWGSRPRHATGVFGQTRRSYVADAHAVRPASGCVNNRDRVFAERRAGASVGAVLDQARGEGGPEGSCRGRFRGTVSYSEAFACPPAGRCRPPRGFPTRKVVVARFSFRVR